MKHLWNIHILVVVFLSPSREGRNQYEKAFGVESKDLFEALYR